MSTVAVIAVLVLGAIAVAAWVWWLLVDLQRFIAPDNADRDAINAKYGEDTPEAGAALEKRFGPGSHWRDARTGLLGLAGIILLIWTWFG